MTTYTQREVARHIAHGATQANDPFVAFAAGWSTRTTVIMEMEAEA